MNQINMNQAVFTTKYVMKEGSPILFIYHFEDGSWQFSGIENDISDEAIMVVGLSEIVEKDKSIIDVLKMPLGFEAIRRDKNSSWQIVASN